MKFLIGFLLGISVATAGALFAQEGGIRQQFGTWWDQNGNAGQYYTGPGGQTDWTDSRGNRGTIYQQPFFGQPKNPC